MNDRKLSMSMSLFAHPMSFLSQVHCSSFMLLIIKVSEEDSPRFEMHSPSKPCPECSFPFYTISLFSRVNSYSIQRSSPKAGTLVGLPDISMISPSVAVSSYARTSNPPKHQSTAPPVECHQSSHTPKL